jgi:hypothetical protein
MGGWERLVQPVQWPSEPWRGQRRLYHVRRDRARHAWRLNTFISRTLLSELRGITSGPLQVLHVDPSVDSLSESPQLRPSVCPKGPRRNVAVFWYVGGKNQLKPPLAVRFTRIWPKGNEGSSSGTSRGPELAGALVRNDCPPVRPCMTGLLGVRMDADLRHTSSWGPRSRRRSPHQCWECSCPASSRCARSACNTSHASTSTALTWRQAGLLLQKQEVDLLIQPV